MRYFGVDASIADRLPELQEQDVRFEDDFVPPVAGPEDGLLKPSDDRTFEVVFGGDRSTSARSSSSSAASRP